MPGDEGLILPTREEPGEGYDIKPPEKMPVRTAFIVYVLEDGHTVASTGFAAEKKIAPLEALGQVLDKLEIAQEATPFDFVRCCHEIVDDTHRGMIVEMMINTQLQLGRQISAQAQQQQENAAILEQIRAADEAARRGRK